MTRLAITTPLTRVAAVRKAQQLLKVNDWGDFLSSDVDGEYGPLTAASVYRAKYWLGFKAPNKVYGPALDEVLRKGKPLPKVMALRRAARIRKRRRAEASKPVRVKALEAAKSQVGINEDPPNSNRVKFSIWYGITGPWCAMFVTWCYVQAGAKGWATWDKGNRYCSCPSMVTDAVNDGGILYAVRDPLPGDVVLYDFDGGVADHVGLFDHWIDRNAGTFAAWEGNTSRASSDDGGEVQYRTDRRRSQVEQFARYRAA
jgi:hypothetical protein